MSRMMAAIDRSELSPSKQLRLGVIYIPRGLRRRGHGRSPKLPEKVETGLNLTQSWLRGGQGDSTILPVTKEGDNRGGVWLKRQNFQKSDRSHNYHLAGCASPPLV